jgi:hypothetical protein
MYNYPHNLTAESCTHISNVTYFGLFSLHKVTQNVGLYDYNLVTNDWNLLVETDTTMIFFGMTHTIIDDKINIITCIPSHNCIMVYETTSKNVQFIPLKQSPNDVSVDVSDNSMLYVCCNVMNEIKPPSYDILFNNSVYKINLNDLTAIECVSTGQINTGITNNSKYIYVQQLNNLIEIDKQSHTKNVLHYSENLLCDNIRMLSNKALIIPIFSTFRKMFYFGLSILSVSNYIRYPLIYGIYDTEKQKITYFENNSINGYNVTHIEKTNDTNFIIVTYGKSSFHTCELELIE